MNKNRRGLRWPYALLLAAALPCCTPVHGCGDLPGEPDLTAQLFLGGNVSDDDWSAFLDTEVTPRFPAGLTVFAANGRWQNPSGQLIREHSRVLVIVMPRRGATIAAVEAIADAYKSRFSQRAVGVVYTDACGAFR